MYAAMLNPSLVALAAQILQIIARTCLNLNTSQQHGGDIKTLAGGPDMFTLGTWSRNDNGSFIQEEKGELAGTYKMT